MGYNLEVTMHANYSLSMTTSKLEYSIIVRDLDSHAQRRLAFKTFNMVSVYYKYTYTL